MGEEKRHQMMQNLFGDQSEEEEEVDSDHESNPQPNFASDEGEGGVEPEGDGDGEAEGQGEVEAESDADMHGVEPDPGESEGERDQSSQEVEAGVQREEREESEGRYTDSDEKEELTSRRRNVVESGSERSDENPYAENEDDEVHQTQTPGSPDEEKDQTHGVSTAAVRNVFGDSDDEEAEEYGIRDDLAHDSNRLPTEEEDISFERSPVQDDIAPDVDGCYESEEEIVEAKIKEKPVGPPMELEIPMRPPPARPEKMHMIKVSNIMGIDSKPFEPKTYVEEDTFVTDESGTKKKIRLENNIVRWRNVRNPDGSISRESNARFVRWSDGSLQLLIGNEVLDITEQDAKHDQAHLFLRHQKGILQSQGRILKKMRFIPSSLTSNSHRLLTALVDSRNKKAFKVKNCVTEFDPEREKEEKEKAESQSIRASLLLSRKREKVSRKYTPNVDRRRQLSPGFLEDALDEEDETDYYDSRRSRNRFEEDLEVEARAEKRILNAKKGSRDAPRKSSMSASKSSHRPVDFSDSERGESEYESEAEEDERSPPQRRAEEEEPEFEEEDDEEEDIEEADRNDASEEEAEEPRQRGSKESGQSLKRKGFESDEESPPRKAASHRRLTVVYDTDED